MLEFKPFENDTQSITVGPGEGVTFENGQENINVYGSYEINKDSDPKEIEDLITILTNIKESIVAKNGITLNSISNKNK